MIIKVQQQTADWLQMRVGRVTGSRVPDVMSRLKNGQPSARRKNYVIELVTERLTGMAVDHFVNDAMIHGTEQEPFACAAYEILTGNDTDRVGMAIHPNIDGFSASPDRAVGEEGLLEVKCPTTAVHIEYMLAGEVPAEYRDQCFAEMACWERQWVDFCSFDPRVPPSMQLFVKRLERDDKRIAEIEFAVVELLAEVEDMLGRLRGKEAPSLKEQLRKSVDDSLILDADIEWIKQQQGVA
jgi:putative phage-type endonuclease